jgi:hypothetical protein
MDSHFEPQFLPNGTLPRVQRTGNPVTIHSSPAVCYGEASILSFYVATIGHGFDHCG